MLCRCFTRWRAALRRPLLRHFERHTGCFASPLFRYFLIFAARRAMLPIRFRFLPLLKTLPRCHALRDMLTAAPRRFHLIFFFRHYFRSRLRCFMRHLLFTQRLRSHAVFAICRQRRVSLLPLLTDCRDAPLRASAVFIRSAELKRRAAKSFCCARVAASASACV